MNRRSVLLGVSGLGLMGSTATRAEEAQDLPMDAPATPALTLRRTGLFGGRPIAYSITAKETPIAALSGDVAGFFSFSYVGDQGRGEPRPVIFSFNGGPGGSSASLHLSGLGPKRVKVGDKFDGESLFGTIELVDSELSILDVADVVFIDPPGTGYSRMQKSGNTASFWGVNEDAYACARFVRTWLTENARWASPIYLLGESYATVRIAAMARDLMGGDQTGELAAVSVAGVMLLSAVNDRTLIAPAPVNDPYFQVYLPSFAAAAHYHTRAMTDHTLEEAIAQASAFAINDYGSALFEGSSLASEKRQMVAQELQHLTGLALPWIEQHELRITVPDFVDALLMDAGERIGKYDTRTAMKAKGEGASHDPSMTQLQHVFAQGIDEYLSSDLKIGAVRPYKLINFKVGASWQDEGLNSGNEYTFTGSLIADAMNVNPRMRLMTLSGVYDLDAPFMSAQHTFRHPMFPSERTFIRRYESGHMCYVGETAYRAFATDVRAFVRGAPLNGNG